MKEIQGTEYTSTKEVCKTLKIQPSTLRKYASMLDEKAKTEFYFSRDDANNRLYTKEDVTVLQLIIELKNKPSYTLETAMNEVIGLSHNSDTGNDIALNDKYIDVVRSFIAQQTNYLEEYQSALQEKDKQIDRLESLVSSLIENTTVKSDTPKKRKWWNVK